MPSRQVTSDERQLLYEYLWNGPMFSAWHWLQWNFDHLRQTGQETYFARVSLGALVRCDRAMKGFAMQMLDRLAVLGGSEKNQDDYEAIKQWLSELLVIHHLVTWKRAEKPVFLHEPSAARGGPNPEAVVEVGAIKLGVEVKTPDLRIIQEARGAATTQLLARLPGTPEEIAEAVNAGGGLTFPRDNPIKDFLQSADRKFASLRDDEFYSVLFIVWSDWINEPISALLSPASGLLTHRSFDRVGDARRTYPNLDAIVVLRHQHQFRRGMANEAPADERFDFLDYGHVGRFPPNALIAVPEGRSLPPTFVDVLQAVPPHPALGAEYVPAELVMWI